MRAVTQLRHSLRSEPACAQPRTGLLPRALPLDPGSSCQIGAWTAGGTASDSVLEHQACAPVRRARLSWGFCVLFGDPRRWTPDDVGGLVEEFRGPRLHTEYSGTGPRWSCCSHIGRRARGGCIVHADCALSPLNLVSS